MTYQPKGGMCANCVHRHRDCSHLPFDQMQVIARSCDVVIVKCLEFERESLPTFTPP